jgi:hypothetical protein
MKTKPMPSKQSKLVSHATDYFGDRPLLAPEIYMRLLSPKDYAKPRTQKLVDFIKKILGIS